MGGFGLLQVSQVCNANTLTTKATIVVFSAQESSNERGRLGCSDDSAGHRVGTFVRNYLAACILLYSSGFFDLTLTALSFSGDSS
ncbi:hypothetical protein GUJ93_ZPchr0137g29182 [Zizania palustris]|uniref:Uncharacterized protein n=1 Tax=Zizania palustris TaxID=103762 RepID=A0A8J5REE4_ZIZPA|nr:hypothetical protein GUJ93_ZPchr0137g29182 [Zizania palustris]